MNTKILRILTVSIPAFLMIQLSGCLKNHDGYTDFSKTTDFVILTGAGTGNFTASNIPMNADTVKKTVTVNLASKDNSNGEITVTLGIDNNLVTAYNTANGKTFQAMPANAFKLLSNKVTVPAGQHYGTTTVEVYRSKLDPSISYILPISITDGGGKQLSSNQNTIYFNVIGNPIAGDYELFYSRWLAADTSGAPNAHNQDLGTTSFAPVTPTQVTTDGAFGDEVIIDFTNTGGVLSNFKASFPSNTAATLGVSSWGPATVVVADPAHGYYKVQFQYVNSVGTRTVVYQYLKQ